MLKVTVDRPPVETREQWLARIAKPKPLAAPGDALGLPVRGVAFGAQISSEKRGSGEVAVRDEMADRCGCVSRNQVRDPSRSAGHAFGPHHGRGLCSRAGPRSRGCQDQRPL
jgi:hypothetical protein